MSEPISDRDARCEPVREEVLEYLRWCREVLASPPGLMHHPTVRKAVAEVLHSVAREVSP